MTRGARLGLLWALLGVAVLSAALAAPIPQDLAYHRFADTRAGWGIPNALNVFSNGGFVLVGLLGLWSLWPATSPGHARFQSPAERWPYAVFFGGFALTGFGSAHYHLAPGNETLVWDRLPLAMTLMGLFAATITERISVKAGLVLLGPLVALGIASVLWWAASERRGEGDLRPYALVQFYPMLAIPLVALLFPSRYTRAGDLAIVVVIYGLAKVFELLDGRLFALGGIVSGHTGKHLAAAFSGYWLRRMIVKRKPARDVTITLHARS